MGRGGRTRSTNGAGAKPNQYKRASSTYQFRLQVINFLRESGSVVHTLDRFYPDIVGPMRESKRKQMYKWTKQRSVIEKMCQSASALQMRSRDVGVGTILSQDAEIQLVQWVNSLRKDGVPVSALMLQLRAQEVATEDGVQDGVFTASRSWMQSWMNRHKLSFRARTRQGQICPADMDSQAIEFASEVKRIMVECGVTKVYNTDQTAVFFEYLPKKTINARGSRTIWVRCGGKEKERLTAMVLGDSDGTKYPPFLVLKSKDSTMKETAADNRRFRQGFGRLVWKEITELQDRLELQCFRNPTGWWNHYLSCRFLKYHFSNREDMSHPVVLLWDDFSGHWTQDVVETATALNVRLVKVPPSLTAVCQPADISWNSPLKAKMRCHWVEYLRSQVASRHSDVQFKIVPPTRKMVIEWFSSCWNLLTSSTIRSGFIKAKFMDAMPLPVVTTTDDANADSMDVEELLSCMAELHLLSNGGTGGESVSEDMDVISAFETEYSF